MADLNEAEIYLEVLKNEFKLFTQSDIALFLGVHQTTIASWIQRNSVKTLRKHIINKKLNILIIDQKVKNYYIVEDTLQSLDNKKEFSDILNQSLPMFFPKYSTYFRVAFFFKKSEIQNLLAEEINKLFSDEFALKNEEEIKEISDKFKKDMLNLINYVTIEDEAQKIILEKLTAAAAAEAKSPF